jgi:hypothetical protein
MGGTAAGPLAAEGLVQRTLCSDCVRMLEAVRGTSSLLYTHSDEVVVMIRGLSAGSKSGGASVAGNVVRLLQRLESFNLGNKREGCDEFQGYF